MSAVLFALTVAASGALQIIECPATQQQKRLIGASMYEGAHKEAELMGGRKRVPGGVDVDYGFNRGDVKWVACWYEPATPRWYHVDPAATRCDLKERGEAPGKMTATVRCK